MSFLQAANLFCEIGQESNAFEHRNRFQRNAASGFRSTCISPWRHPHSLTAAGSSASRLSAQLLQKPCHTCLQPLWRASRANSLLYMSAQMVGRRSCGVAGQKKSSSAKSFQSKIRFGGYRNPSACLMQAIFAYEHHPGVLVASAFRVPPGYLDIWCRSGPSREQPQTLKLRLSFNLSAWTTRIVGRRNCLGLPNSQMRQIA